MMDTTTSWLILNSSSRCENPTRSFFESLLIMVLLVAIATGINWGRERWRRR